MLAAAVLTELKRLLSSLSVAGATLTADGDCVSDADRAGTPAADSVPVIRHSAVALVGVLAIVLVGCSRTTPMPAGARQIHVLVTASEVRLDPATVQAGDVYLVLDGPVQSVSFVQRKRTEAETPGPLTDDELARLAHGDTQGTSIEGMSVGCSDSQRAEDRGQMGPCGNVYKVVLVEGKYAILGPGWTQQETEPSSDPTAGAPGVLPPFMAVLEVLP